MCRTWVFCTFFDVFEMMKKSIFLLLVLVLATSCGTSRRVSREAAPSWVGHSTQEILQTMGDPDRIDDDGNGGSILCYEAKPNYDDPSYDILDPDVKPGLGGHAYFYLDQEGDCYRVDASRKLPAPSHRVYSDDGNGFWIDILIYLPLFLIGILL